MTAWKPNRAVMIVSSLSSLVPTTQSSPLPLPPPKKKGQEKDDRCEFSLGPRNNLTAKYLCPKLCAIISGLPFTDWLLLCVSRFPAVWIRRVVFC